MSVQGGNGADLIVEVRNASRRFRVGSEDIWAVRDVSLQVRRGEFVGLIGRSGSGKTTLLNLVAGLDQPSEGTVFVGGEEITRYSERQLTEMRRRRVGFVFQSFGLLPLLSAYENVELALRIAGTGVRERRRRASELLEAVGLAGRARHRPYELSGGEQQRVAIARALANDPVLILADEPTGELDSSTAVSIFKLLHDLVEERGVTILTTTHDRTVMELVPRVEEMRDGRLLEPEEQELFRYTVREERSRFAAELPPDIQEEVSASSVEAVDFAPTEAERVAATVAAHPELSEAAARSTVSAGPERDAEAEVGEEDRSFAPPADVERPRWGEEPEAAEEDAVEEPEEPVAEVEAEEVEEPAGEVLFAPPEGASRPAWSREEGVVGVEEEEAELAVPEEAGVGEEDRSFAPPADVERPRWGGEPEASEDGAVEEPEELVAEIEAEEVIEESGSEDEGELVVEGVAGDDSGSASEAAVAEVGEGRRSEWARPQKTEL